MTAEMHWSYDILKQMAIEGASKSDLEDMKELLSNEIGSARKMDRIHTIQDLIDCLERGDQINEENVDAFRTIGRQNPPLLQALDSYQKVPFTRPFVNQYREQRLADQLRQQLHISASHHIAPPQAAVAPQPQPQNYVVTAQFTAEKRAAIFKKISQECGRSWRELGRKLGIGEGIMDDIETTYPRDLKSRILRLLQIFEEDECNDPRQLLLQLCQGLADCGRKDLRKKVEQIMSH
ncbi:fas-associated death domain protein [Drosophila albomicans]|uniref:Fas-associated death domain protein n=1 Tax=Drosophila albomicans TaxID=7291 RepID=A0A9C6SYR4_DROAB|nr:fas-associated death domain protein [Drosophila albomicans]